MYNHHDHQPAEFHIHIDIYNADLLLPSFNSNSQIQAKILINTLDKKHENATKFVNYSFQGHSGLFHYDWYENVTFIVSSKLKPEYMADIIIQLIDKSSLSVIAYTRLNFNEIYKKYEYKDNQLLTSFELINVNLKKRANVPRVAQILMQIKISSKHACKLCPICQTPYTNTKNVDNNVIQLIPMMHRLFEINAKENNTDRIEHLTSKFTEQFKEFMEKGEKKEEENDEEEKQVICRKFGLVACNKFGSTAHRHQMEVNGDSQREEEQGFCFWNMVEARRKAKHISNDSEIDNVFYIFAFNEQQESIIKMIKNGLNILQNDPNDTARKKASFSTLKEIKILIKMLIHRSTNPLCTAMEIATNLKNIIDKEIYERIEEEIKLLIEFAQNEAISHLKKYSSNRAKHIAIEADKTMELAIDNKFTTFIACEDVVMFRNGKWTENPENIITGTKDNNIDNISSAADELDLWSHSFGGTFVSAFKSSKNGKDYFKITTFDQQKKYFYSPLGIYQFEYCIFLIYIIFFLIDL
eukprot:355703_1